MPTRTESNHRRPTIGELEVLLVVEAAKSAHTNEIRMALKRSVYYSSKMNTSATLRKMEQDCGLLVSSDESAVLATRRGGVIRQYYSLSELGEETLNLWRENVNKLSGTKLLAVGNGYRQGQTVLFIPELNLYGSKEGIIVRVECPDEPANLANWTYQVRLADDSVTRVEFGQIVKVIE